MLASNSSAVNLRIESIVRHLFDPAGKPEDSKSFVGKRSQYSIRLHTCRRTLGGALRLLQLWSNSHSCINKMAIMQK